MPHEVGMFKIWHFPEKIKQILQVSTERVDPTYPTVVELSLTATCNLGCVWCCDKDLRDKCSGQIEKEVLDRLFDDLKEGGVSGITVEGGGEPSVHPDFVEIIRSAKEKGLRLGILTNGVRKELLECADAFDWMRVSLDATTKEEYESVKGHDCFDQVMSNLEKMAKVCPSVGVGFLVAKNNCSDLVHLTKRVREMGCSYLHFRPVLDTPDMVGGVSFEEVKRLCDLETEQFSIMIAMIENEIRGNAGLPCRCSSLRSVISSDGSVFICGRLNGYRWWPALGNINRESFRSIWEGDHRRSQHAAIMSADFCRMNCPTCRITKFNVEANKAVLSRTKHFI